MKNILDYNGTTKQILSLIYTRQQITRKTLSKITGFSGLTIARIITSLIKDGVVIETDAASADKGRKPLLLEINPGYGYIIGVDIGTYSTKIGVVDFSGRLVEKEIHVFVFRESPSTIMNFDLLQVHIDALIKKYGVNRVLGIGMGITGLVDYYSQTIVFCPNIRGYNNLEASRLLQKRFGIPAVVDTSARCMALAEKYFGKSEVTEDLSFVSFGHSIAVGTIIGNTIFRGSNGFAGELGHVKTVLRDDRICTCGSYNCIEVYITLPEMRMALINRLKEFRGYSQLKEKYELTGEISYEDIASAVQGGDKVAVEGMGETIQMLGTVLADYINLFNPSEIVLGGGFFDLYPFVMPDLEKELQKQCLTPSLQNIRLRISELSMDGAIIGSAMQLVHRYFVESN
ncbi:MAG: ROK family protein [Treponema sp.]|nr:ROK family protein [Treponema sp.]